MEITCFFFIYMITNNYDIHEFAEGAVILDGLDDAIIGIVEEFGNGPRILYSKNKVLQILEERDGMSPIDAVEFYEYNILGLFASDQNPVFLISE